MGEAWSWPGEVRPLLRLEMEDVGVRREEVAVLTAISVELRQAVRKTLGQILTLD